MDLPEHFDQIDTETVRRYVKEQQEENLQLEFKTVAASQMARADRKNYAIALSGFANSSGGLIVWGVDARKNAQGVDCAQRACEIHPLRLFVSRLNDLEGQMVSPVAEGVRHKPLDTEQDSGFAVTMVPETDLRPRMAKAGEDRYYRRSGDSFYRMEHFDLEDMFGRRAKPRLHLEARVRKDGSTTSSGQTTHHMRVVLAVHNTGRGMARFPYVAIHGGAEERLVGFRERHSYGIPALRGGKDLKNKTFGGGPDVVIHAGTCLDLAEMPVDVMHEQASCPNIVLRYTVAADGIAAREGEVQVAGEEILCMARGRS